MVPGRRQLFIYWRIAPAELGTALQALRHWQESLRAAHPALQCRLYRRHDGTADTATVMECYADAAPGIDEALRQHIERAGSLLLQPWLRGPRHVEVFDACDD